MRSKRFADRSLPGKLWALALLVLSVTLVVAAERDIARRPPEQIRGSKLPWRLASLNAIGAAGYLRFGRRPLSG
jgi:hypothetical protein